MLKKRIIPCLDVDNGRVVKGVNFIDLIDAGDPVEQAKLYNSEGADELCFLDITASSDNRQTLLNTVKKTAENCFIPLTVGGGVRNLEDIKKLLHAGADKVSINTSAVLNKEFVKKAAEKYGSSTVVIAVDAKNISDNKWEVFTHGGREATGIDAIDYCQEVANLGAGEILLTSMDRDGTKLGFDVELLKRITSKIHIPVIASGGVGTLEHFSQGILQGGANSVLAASVFHFGHFKIQDVKRYLADKNIPVRI
ncbi:imidazole glycerol phosphate synthase subunit HisF [Pelagibacteraceae bacterium]|nr:imidazole glycerol phosphate synthase subunit HisF [Pelagibacteraceae bacterium]